MEWWQSLLIGVLGGLIVSGLTLIIKNTLSGKFKVFQFLVPAKVRKSITWEYKNAKRAEKSIAKDISTSRTMRVFCLKGATFCNIHASGDKIPFTTLHAANKLVSQKYLISDTGNPLIRH